MVIGVHRVNCVEYWMFGPGIIMSCFPLQEGTLTGGKMKGVPWRRKGDLPPIWDLGIRSVGLSSRYPHAEACGTWCTRSLGLQVGMECSPGWQEPRGQPLQVSLPWCMVFTPPRPPARVQEPCLASWSTEGNPVGSASYPPGS